MDWILGMVPTVATVTLLVVAYRRRRRGGPYLDVDPRSAHHIPETPANPPVTRSMTH